eukprot:TRINITY_DN104618_c0_g1_i1.p1 TRINITY_DN104618_c0_g1~~TRINITY_DN104618_c0_g1_i1.p1  ORF type:complete len:557 (-),score=98.21 TRINITY_DN104618_c0_g1_i1:16-1686(-)
MPGQIPQATKQVLRDAEEAGASCDETTPLKPKCEGRPSLLYDPKGWMQALTTSYSWKLLAMVAVTSHFLKGFVAGGGDEGLIGKPVEFLLSDLGVGAGRLQILKAAAIAPFALKPVIALISDAFPIFGYRKMPYVVITTVASFIAVLAIGWGFADTEGTLVLALFLAFLQVASVDVLMAAKQSEEVKQKASLGPEFVTYNWLGVNIGQVASVCVLGPIIASLGNHTPYRIAAPMVLLVLYPALCNFLGEKRLSREELKNEPSIFNLHPVLCLLTMMIGVLAVGLVAFTILLHEGHLIHIALGMSCAVLVSFAMFIRWEITGPVLFFFLLGLLSFNIDGAFFYFCTDNSREFSLGPHFSPNFYITGIGAAAFLGILFGFMTGAEIFRAWSYRNICVVTLLLRACTQLALIPVLRRWTGPVPDSVWILTVGFLDNMIQAWRWIPKQVMAAHLAPKGVEATALGLHAGTFNMASILSSHIGSYILSQYGVTPEGEVHEGHEFQDLWKVQCAAAFAPLLLILLVPLLLPEKSQTEVLLEECEESATHNSLFERLRRRHRI